MFNCTETPFVCISRIEIVGSTFEGLGWFFVMLLVAFGLQVADNFLWLKNSQYSREILQLKPGDSKRTKLIGLSVLWTAVSTIVWIIRVIFVMGNNLWMFISILLGNIAGTYFASIQQAADEDNTLDVIIQEFEKESVRAYRLRDILLQLPKTKVHVPKTIIY
jgi:hypothetical protein